MKRKPRGQMSESLLIAALLSISGGLQDAYTYISRGKVFANAQTGNIVLLSQRLVEGDWAAAAHYFVPLLFFAMGIAASEGIRFKYQKAQKIHWRQLVLFAEVLLLFLVGFLSTEYNLIGNALVSFSCAMQVQAFRKVKGYAFASTMCIGNMRSGMEALCAYFRCRDREVLQKALTYFAVILVFAAGAGIGSVVSNTLGSGAIWICCVLLSVSFCLMFIREKQEES